MTSRTRTIFLVLLGLSLIVPTLFQLWLFSQQYAVLKTSPTVRMNVSGFDPRDTVRGRYATIVLNWPDPTGDSAHCKTDALYRYGRIDGCGLCLNADQNGHARTSLHPHQEQKPPSCLVYFPQMVVVGNEIQPTDLRNIQLRVYLDESVANEVDNALRQQKVPFTADIVFPRDGDPFVKTLYMDGTPYRAFINPPR